MEKDEARWIHTFATVRVHCGEQGCEALEGFGRLADLKKHLIEAHEISEEHAECVIRDLKETEVACWAWS